ncbi:MAG: DNA gyrase inhibitor YacG [Pelagibacteraceae bacterium]|nr:DNA gyrase inhibitor YacG [Pelagibacteraceae bacterium]
MEVVKKNNIIQLKKKKSNCPTCKKIPKEPFSPFCSKKCAELDLMKWLSDEHQTNIN